MAIGIVRNAYQAGRFYSADMTELKTQVTHFIQSAPLKVTQKTPIGFVAPHAGYDFSGTTAGHTYRQLAHVAPPLIFVFAPSHHAAFKLASIWNGPGYGSPLGTYPIHTEMVQKLMRRLPNLQFQKWAEEIEHSLEVQIPFLQIGCPKSQMVPLVVGDQDRDNIETLADGICDICQGFKPGDVAFVASSDAYHGYTLDICRKSDSQLAQTIVTMDLGEFYEAIESGRCMACGYGSIAAVMSISARMGAGKGVILHQSTSADSLDYSAGSYVVGYLSAMFE